MNVVTFHRAINKPEYFTKSGCYKKEYNEAITFTNNRAWDKLNRLILSQPKILKIRFDFEYLHTSFNSSFPFTTKIIDHDYSEVTLGYWLLAKSCSCPKGHIAQTIFSMMKEEFNINIILPFFSGTTPLFIAAKLQQWDLAKLMIEYTDGKVNVNLATELGETLFLIAAHNKQWDLVKLMIENADGKVNVNAYVPHLHDPKLTPLWFAAFNKQWDLVKLMIENADGKVKICAKPRDFGCNLSERTVISFLIFCKKWDIAYSLFNKIDTKDSQSWEESINCLDIHKTRVLSVIHLFVESTVIQNHYFYKKDLIQFEKLAHKHIVNLKTVVEKSMQRIFPIELIERVVCDSMYALNSEFSLLKKNILFDRVLKKFKKIDKIEYPILIEKTTTLSVLNFIEGRGPFAINCTKSQVFHAKNLVRNQLTLLDKDHAGFLKDNNIKSTLLENMEVLTNLTKKTVKKAILEAIPDGY